MMMNERHDKQSNLVVVEHVHYIISYHIVAPLHGFVLLFSATCTSWTSAVSCFSILFRCCALASSVQGLRTRDSSFHIRTHPHSITVDM
ncbi:hypothetical protein OG21DRAFT_1027681 [Imleria badia]|nr:hypothetical protein OG21DRAFT_1027681 [Imleria badia]